MCYINLQFLLYFSMIVYDVKQIRFYIVNFRKKMFVMLILTALPLGMYLNLWSNQAKTT